MNRSLPPAWLVAPDIYCAVLIEWACYGRQQIAALVERAFPGCTAEQIKDML